MDYSIIIISLMLTAFFSGSEIAYITANRLKLEVDQKKGDFPAPIIKRFVQNPSHFLATMLVGNTISLVVFGIFIVKVLTPWLTDRFGLSEDGRLLIAQIIISAAIMLITAEFIPKTLFRLNPNLLLNILALPLFIFYLLLFPIASFSRWLSNIFISKLSKTYSAESNGPTAFNKLDLNRLMTDNKSIPGSNAEVDSEIRIFQNALDFSAIKVRDCMIPRTEIIAVEINEPVDKATQLFINTGLSRILVYNENIDNIIGYFKYSELFTQPKTIRSKMVGLPIVPESMAANVLLERFIKEKKSIAVVVDEFGGTAGVVTLEDIMEEIFGDIEDEHDYIQLTETKINHKEFVFSGRLEVDYLNETFELNLPEQEEFNTLAGYILHHFPHIPNVGEIVETDDYEIKILKVSETRIELVNLKVK